MSEPQNAWEKSHLDRPRGIFTQAERMYLFGHRSFEDAADPENAERQCRYQLRERFRNAILDFALLFEIPDRDITVLFEDCDFGSYEELARDCRSSSPNQGLGTSDELMLGIASMFAFFYRIMHRESPELAAYCTEKAVTSALFGNAWRERQCFELFDARLETEPVASKSAAGLASMDVPADLPEDPELANHLLAVLCHLGHVPLHRAQYLIEEVGVLDGESSECEDDSPAESVS